MIFYQKQWQFLVKSAQLGKVGHAYLFSGPSGLGKKEMALEFARFLNCRSGKTQDASCGVCPSCLETAKGCHPDFLMVENNPKEEEKQIDLIKEISQWLGLKPLLGQYRVVVISQLQSFSLPAQSAFLKTLEEPRGNAVLIATSDYPELLLATIVSRVKEIKFAPLSVKRLAEAMIADGTDSSLA
jgi:DNA polymerase-3 subunit delta'